MLVLVQHKEELELEKRANEQNIAEMTERKQEAAIERKKEEEKQIEREKSAKEESGKK